MTSLSLDNNNEKEEKIRKILVEITTIRKQKKRFTNYTKKHLDRLAAQLHIISTLVGRIFKAERLGLLSSHAGKTKIEGATIDEHGNPVGYEFDLGVGGASMTLKLSLFNFFPFPNENIVRI